MSLSDSAGLPQSRAGILAASCHRVCTHTHTHTHTHTRREGSYVWLTWAYNGAREVPSNPLGFMWREYGRADSRWSGYDATVLSLELITVLLLGPLAVACAYAVMRRCAWRHVAQLIICVCELYGGIMTFGPEWLARPIASPSLTSDPWMVAVYLFFMNGLWVWVPLVLAYDSAVKLVRGMDKAKAPADDDVPSGEGAYTLLAASLVLYTVLVPYALLTAKTL